MMVAAPGLAVRICTDNRSEMREAFLVGPASQLVCSSCEEVAETHRNNMTDRARMQAAEQAQRIVDLWQERPRWQRTAEHLLPFYGWLLEHEPAVIPTGPGSILKVSTILAAHLICQGESRIAAGHSR